MIQDPKCKKTLNTYICKRLASWWFWDLFIWTWPIMHLSKLFWPGEQIQYHHQLERHHKTQIKEELQIRKSHYANSGWIELVFRHLPFVFENSFMHAHGQILNHCLTNFESVNWKLNGSEPRIAWELNSWSHDFELFIPLFRSGVLVLIPDCVTGVMSGHF